MSRSLIIDGIKWLIHEERDPANLGGEPVLICYGPGIARRIRHFPANWRDLADDELMRICRGR
jgi:hypothetical protein